MVKVEDTHFPEADDYIARLKSGEVNQELVIVAIPSHDKNEKPIKDQDQWADACLELLGDLYGGATAFKTFKGIYKKDDGSFVCDNPIMIESFACSADIEDAGRLQQLLDFAKRLGQKAKQEAVMIVIGRAMFLIKDFKRS